MYSDALIRNASVLVDILSELKRVSPYATLNTAQAFLIIASRPGLTVGEVQSLIGMEATHTARAISVMYKKHRKTDGMDLIRHEADNEDMRIKHLHLTAKGETIWRSIRGHMERLKEGVEA